MKDNFSDQSDKYAKYRPSYPSDFYEFLYGLIANKQNAWDCGTGNGQVAYQLSSVFEQVCASDISEAQLVNALQAYNIEYSVQPAEKNNYKDDQFDLIIVAQAIHWFDFDKFYTEVYRTGRKDAILCVLGYGLVEISPEIDKIIAIFYNNVLGNYWDSERKYIDERYRTIPFPFNEISAPDFAIAQQWSLPHFIGYLNTWSAVKHFIKRNGYNPVDKLMWEIEKQWDAEQMQSIRFPLFMRVGKVK